MGHRGSINENDKIEGYKDRIKVLKAKLSIEDNTSKRYEYQDKIDVLQLRIDIENLKQKIRKKMGK